MAAIPFASFVPYTLRVLIALALAGLGMLLWQLSRFLLVFGAVVVSALSWTIVAQVTRLTRMPEGLAWV